MIEVSTMSLLIDHSVVSCANIRGVAQHYVGACATERMLSLANERRGL